MIKYDKKLNILDEGAAQGVLHAILVTNDVQTKHLVVVVNVDLVHCHLDLVGSGLVETSLQKRNDTRHCYFQRDKIEGRLNHAPRKLVGPLLDNGEDFDSFNRLGESILHRHAEGVADSLLHTRLTVDDELIALRHLSRVVNGELVQGQLVHAVAFLVAREAAKVHRALDGRLEYGAIERRHDLATRKEIQPALEDGNHRGSTHLIRGAKFSVSGHFQDVR